MAVWGERQCYRMWPAVVSLLRRLLFHKNLSRLTPKGRKCRTYRDRRIKNKRFCCPTIQNAKIREIKRQQHVESRKQKFTNGEQTLKPWGKKIQDTRTIQERWRCEAKSEKETWSEGKTQCWINRKWSTNETQKEGGKTDKDRKRESIKIKSKEMFMFFSTASENTPRLIYKAFSCLKKTWLLTS